MRRYEHALARLSYGNAVVLRSHIDHAWIEANLIKEELWRISGVNGETYYCGDIVFYGCTSLADGTRLYAFRNPENKKRVLEGQAGLVVEADPDGPDRCPGCGGPSQPVVPLTRRKKVPVEVTVITHKSGPVRTIIDLVVMFVLGFGSAWLLCS